MKVKGTVTILAICLLMTGISYGQHTKQFFEIDEESPVLCGSDIIHQRLLIEDDSYREVFENQSEALRQSVAKRSGSNEKSMITYTVPVVVHVMHTGEAEGTGVNISDEQIQSAIYALNEDFRKIPGSNGDGDGVDVEMEFCLASRAPNGNPSDGINRINASSLANYSNEGISIGQGSGANETSLKDLSRWDRDDYYNIWVVNEIEDNDGGSGIQGFAYFPSSSASKDGTVILYNAFGTVGTLKSYTNMNRTTTHEMGHAFGLYHTFQGNSCSESNCSSEGDEVCDTPPTVSNTGCGSPACGGTQQVENYMDYTPQTCRDMFTLGQKDRMRSALLNARSSLLNSLGCTPPNALDAGIVNVISPLGYTCSTTFAPQVELKNFGSNSINSVEIKYRVDSGSLQTYSYSGNLASGDSEVILLPMLTASTGAHSFEAYTQSPNGGTDGFQSNDTFISQFEVVSGSSITVAIEVDNYGNETSWDIQDGNGTVVASGGPYPDNASGTVFETEVCLSNDCFDFTIYDSYGDGICCGFGFGSYEVTDGSGDVLAESDADFEDSETTSFCMGGGNTAPVSDFSSAQTLVCVGSGIQFIDQSTGNPDTWSWSFPGGSPSASSAQNPTISYSSIGTKTVTLTTSNAEGSDTETKTAYITVDEAALLSTSVTDASCFNSADGSVDLSRTGGTGPFSYNWTNGANTQDLAELTSGTYTVTMIDAASCEVSASATVAAPEAIILSNTSSTSASCSNDGSATVSPTGGSPGYTYLWNDSEQQTSQTADQLLSGNYTVIVTDSEGCQSSTTVFVNGISTIDLSNGSKTHITCSGDSNGSATVNPNGGDAPYTVLWGDGQTTATATSLSGGTHLVTVTDVNGCQASRTFFIQEPEAIATTTVSLTADSCDLNVGRAEISVSGGTGQKTIQWNDTDEQSGAVLQGVRFGQYTAEIEDENDCIAFYTVEIEDAECSVTGLEEATIASVEIFPNPVVNGQFNLDAGSGFEGVIRVILIEITGKEVQNWSINSGQGLQVLQLSSNISEGVYLLQLSDGVKVITDRIIIR